MIDPSSWIQVAGCLFASCSRHLESSLEDIDMMGPLSARPFARLSRNITVASLMPFQAYASHTSTERSTRLSFPSSEEQFVSILKDFLIDFHVYELSRSGFCRRYFFTFVVETAHSFGNYSDWSVTNKVVFYHGSRTTGPEALIIGLH